MPTTREETLQMLITCYKKCRKAKGNPGKAEPVQFMNPNPVMRLQLPSRRGKHNWKQAKGSLWT